MPQRIGPKRVRRRTHAEVRRCLAQSAEMKLNLTPTMTRPEIEKYIDKKIEEEMNGEGVPEPGGPLTHFLLQVAEYISNKKASPTFAVISEKQWNQIDAQLNKDQTWAMRSNRKQIAGCKIFVVPGSDFIKLGR